MSTVEIYTDKPSPKEAAAEAVAAQVRHNLRQFELGERDYFEAHFPVNIEGHDEYGQPNGINDIAHNRFLENIGLGDKAHLTDDYIELSSGTKIFYRQLEYSDGTTFQISYQSGPFDVQQPILAD